MRWIDREGGGIRMTTCTRCGAVLGPEGRCPSGHDDGASGDKAPRTEFFIRSWLQDASGAERTFEDRQLLSYRHPQEFRALAVAAAAVLLVASGAAVVLDSGVLVVGLVVGWLAPVVAIWLQVAQLMGGNVEITPTQLV